MLENITPGFPEKPWGERPEDKIVAEGTLTKIIATGSNEVFLHNAGMAGAYRESAGYAGTYSVIELRSGDGEVNEFTVDVQIYPDSIGNNLQIWGYSLGGGFKSPPRRVGVFDVDLDRWYSSRVLPKG